MRQMKRMICFLAAAVLALVLPVSGFACEHYNKTVFTKDLKSRGYKDPQVGVPGYSGDLCCPVCGEVVIPGEQIPPLQPPSEKPGAPNNPSGTAVQEQTGSQTNPEEPAKPGTPAQTKPEEPVRPEKPVQTAAPANTKEPARPTEGKKPKATARPGKTVTTNNPAHGKPQDSGGNTAGRERFSTLYPYRRVKMHPEPGIRAEAAGILLWPAAVSPFQNMLD